MRSRSPASTTPRAASTSTASRWSPRWICAVDEINAAGGLLGRKLQLINYDPQSNIQLYTQFATEAATKDKVAVVHGGITSASREAIRPLLKRYNTLYFYNTLYEGGVCDRNSFCTGSTPAQTVEPAGALRA